MPSSSRQIPEIAFFSAFLVFATASQCDAAPMQCPYEPPFARVLAPTGELVAPAPPAKTSAVTLDWLDRLAYADINAPPSADYLTPITAGLNSLLKLAIPANDYRLVNSLFALMDPPQMRVDVMVAVLRTLFPVRKFLLDYRTKRDDVRSELSQVRGMDADSILRGLL